MDRESHDQIKSETDEPLISRAAKGGAEHRARSGETAAAWPLRLRSPNKSGRRRTVAACVGVVMDAKIEPYRFAVRDLAVLESRKTPEVTRLN